MAGDDLSSLPGSPALPFRGCNGSLRMWSIWLPSWAGKRCMCSAKEVILVVWVGSMKSLELVQTLKYSFRGREQRIPLPKDYHPEGHDKDKLPSPSHCTFSALETFIPMLRTFLPFPLCCVSVPLAHFPTVSAVRLPLFACSNLLLR